MSSKCPDCGGELHQFEDYKFGCDKCLRTYVGNHINAFLLPEESDSNLARLGIRKSDLSNEQYWYGTAPNGILYCSPLNFFLPE